MKNHKSRNNESIHFESKEFSKHELYWTEERIKKAKPVPKPEVGREELERLKEKFGGDGVQESVEGFSPELDELRGTPTNANVSERPFWNGGKIYFTKPDGKDYYGSAQFCGDEFIVLTAAHCVRDNKTGEWYTNVVFRRAYDNGGGQTVSMKSLTTKSAWHNGEDEKPYEIDYAFLVTNTKSGAGWMGWKTLIPYTSWTAIGYPKNYDGGKTMQKVDGTKGTVSSGIVQMLGNPMTGGCSGGAWIGDLKSSGSNGNYAISVNSFHYTGQPENEWGPYFDSKFSDLYRYAISLKT